MYDNAEEVWNAFARMMEGPRNPMYALQELAEKLERHGRQALREWDEMKAHEQELEGENAELRRRLRMAGVNDKVEVAA